MKAVFFPLAALVLLQSAPASAAPTLVALDCVSNTGVIIQSVGQTANGLAVESKWGLFERKFTARTGISTLGTTSYIELLGDKHVEYFLALNIKHDTAEVQKIAGTLLRVNAVDSLPPTIVGAVQCDVTVK
jgi:hypothetical protein